jgi:hypothetical protein
MSGETVTIYGASDDLVEVEGNIDGDGEYGCYAEEWEGTLTSPEGESLIVRAEFGAKGSAADWRISVENTQTYPGWPMHFARRPDREGDPALVIEVPAGTKLTVKESD